MYHCWIIVLRQRGTLDFCSALLSIQLDITLSIWYALLLCQLGFALFSIRL